MASKCKICKGDEVLYEPKGLRTRVSLDGTFMILHRISDGNRTEVPINFCPSCGRNLHYPDKESETALTIDGEVILYFTGEDDMETEEKDNGN